MVVANHENSILSSHNFVVKCSINLKINKALQLDVENTYEELEGEIMRNSAFKKSKIHQNCEIHLFI